MMPWNTGMLPAMLARLMMQWNKISVTIEISNLGCQKNRAFQARIQGVQKHYKTGSATRNRVDEYSGSRDVLHLAVTTKFSSDLAFDPWGVRASDALHADNESVLANVTDLIKQLAPTQSDGLILRLRTTTNCINELYDGTQLERQHWSISLMTQPRHWRQVDDVQSYVYGSSMTQMSIMFHLRFYQQLLGPLDKLNNCKIEWFFPCDTLFLG